MQVAHSRSSMVYWCYAPVNLCSQQAWRDCRSRLLGCWANCSVWKLFHLAQNQQYCWHLRCPGGPARCTPGNKKLLISSLIVWLIDRFIIDTFSVLIPQLLLWNERKNPKISHFIPFPTDDMKQPRPRSPAYPCTFSQHSFFPRHFVSLSCSQHLNQWYSVNKN